MCLAVPGKILTILDDDALCREGNVAFSGVVKAVNLMLVPDAKPDDYVLVHAGVAISKLDELQAEQSLQALDAMQIAASAAEPQP